MTYSCAASTIDAWLRNGISGLAEGEIRRALSLLNRFSRDVSCVRRSAYCRVPSTPGNAVSVAEVFRDLPCTFSVLGSTRECPELQILRC